jgi:threonine dehydratase
MGAPFVFDEMWPLASTLLKGALVIRLEAVADAIRLLAARQRIVAEGAGAVALAAALTCLPSEFHGRKVVCLVSGGNISQHHLVEVLSGNVPA